MDDKKEIQEQKQITKNYEIEESNDLDYDEYDFKIDEWLDKVNNENIEPKATLYGFKSSTGESKELLWQWEGRENIPSIHEVGLQFGSGRYVMIFNIPKGINSDKKTTSRRFRIGSYYDQAKRNLANGLNYNAQFNSCLPFPMQKEKIEDTKKGFSEVVEVINMLKPLLTNNNNNAMQEAGMVSQMMIGMFQNVNKLMQSQMLENMKMMNDLNRKTLSIDYDNEESEDLENDGVIGMIKPLLKFLPMLLKKGAVGEAAKTMVTENEDFQRLIKNTKDLYKVVRYLRQTSGKEKTDLVLQKLNIPITDFEEIEN